MTAPGPEWLAYFVLEVHRWKGSVICPRCGAGQTYFLQPRDGHARKTRTGALSERRVWSCGVCRRQFSVLTGTMLEGTKVSLWTWMFVIDDLAAEPGITTWTVHRRYGIDVNTARRMLTKIKTTDHDPILDALTHD